jgi:hypothetical protein
MQRPRQFTLSYLFLEMFWIAAALGCFSQLLRVQDVFWMVLVIYGVLFSAVAIGGLFRRMVLGFLIGFVLVAFALFGSLPTLLLQHGGAARIGGSAPSRISPSRWSRGSPRSLMPVRTTIKRVHN